VWKQVAESSVGQPAEVANPWEALGQDVLGKAAQELVTRNSQGTWLMVSPAHWSGTSGSGDSDRSCKR
jgi:hypothetical protein